MACAEASPVATVSSHGSRLFAGLSPCGGLQAPLSASRRRRRTPVPRCLRIATLLVVYSWALLPSLNSQALGWSLPRPHLLSSSVRADDVRRTAVAGRRRMGMMWFASAVSAATMTPEVAHAEPQMPYEKSMGAVPTGKRRTRYENWTLSDSGLQWKDAIEGKATAVQPTQGDIVVISWEGYTINYFGRPFETKTLNKVAKLEQEPLRFRLGDQTVIPAIDEAVRTMREGGVRQLIVPVEISYDDEKKLKPRPTTFSGQRALDFVMDNKGGMMDKTLLININLQKVYKD